MGIRPIDAEATYQSMVKTIAAMMSTRRWMRRDESNEDEILSVIQNAPTLDYAPVRHGEWDDKIVAFCNVCSVCKVFVDRACFPTVRHKGVLMPNIGALNYCPNCGAKMDGGKTNE